MRLYLIAAIFSLGLAVLLPSVYAWGAVGHQIVATIAQMYLHKDVLPTLCDILGLPRRNCHLASVATWADKERFRMRWSAALHYIGSVDDHPSETCSFPGEHKWQGAKGINVLDAIRNTTSLLQAWMDKDVDDSVANEALKFLIHFVGDMHQPLHLTGRDRGGNSIPVLFDRRHTNLHSVWDTYLVSKAVRTTPQKYSRPLAYPKVEEPLQGTIYDSYIRRIVSEGVLKSWRDDVPTWLTCPDATSIHSKSVVNSGLLGLWESLISGTDRVVRAIASKLNLKMGVEITPDGSILCPYFWAQPNHQLNCEVVWPAELDEEPFNARLDIAEAGDICQDDHGHELDLGEVSIPFTDVDSDNQTQCNIAGRPPLLQLDSPEYSGVIADRMIVEKLLAQGGIRLAGILNYIFVPTGGKNGPDGGGLYIMDIDV